ncbi:unnamed protein product [Thelazia callipaeda]|uniref:C3H1-type domain-containing protein n=1 Tax=Thelazia callipaeda TaxID=103827 RepID=A0A0N5CKQ7_THECL|nr:unnamed protein product [Thelazia callipaeda]
MIGRDSSRLPSSFRSTLSFQSLLPPASLSAFPQPSSSFLPTFLPDSTALHLINNNMSGYWQNAQQFYGAINPVISNQNQYHGSLFTYSTDLFREHSTNHVTKLDIGPRPYVHYVDPPPAPHEVGTYIKQDPLTLQITKFNRARSVQSVNENVINKNQQMFKKISQIFDVKILKIFANFKSVAVISAIKDHLEHDGQKTQSESSLTSRSQFRGKIYMLPENCTRPQSSEGRTFPLKVRSEDMNFDSSDHNELLQEKNSNQNSPKSPVKSVMAKYTPASDQAPVFIRTATKIVRKAVYPSQKTLAGNHTAIKSQTNVEADSSYTKLSSQKYARSTKRVVGNGTMSRDGMSWKRQTSDSQHTVTTQKEFLKPQRINRRLRRIKETSNECFEFAEHGKCLAGAFCSFDHNGDSGHKTIKICYKLMLGLCRGDCGHSHFLPSHQMPVCANFLQLNCWCEDCPYLHVKHKNGNKRCDDFNRGVCTKGVDVRYLIVSVLHPQSIYFSKVPKKCILILCIYFHSRILKCCYILDI